jgi:hypothetical protein
MPSHDVKESEMKHNGHLIKFTFAGLLILHPVAVFAAPDMAAYDVAGIRIGMTPDQVKPILAAKLGITSAKIVTVTLPNALIGKHCVAALSGQNQGVRIIVNFETKSPINTVQPMIVSQISYEMPWSEENAKSMKAVATAKYGIPSQSVGIDRWCQDARFGCTTPAQAVLELSATKLTLSDLRLSEARQKLTNDKNKRVPGF